MFHLSPYSFFLRVSIFSPRTFLWTISLIMTSFYFYFAFPYFLLLVCILFLTLLVTVCAFLMALTISMTLFYGMYVYYVVHRVIFSNAFVQYLLLCQHIPHFFMLIWIDIYISPLLILFLFVVWWLINYIVLGQKNSLVNLIVHREILSSNSSSIVSTMFLYCSGRLGIM